MLTIPTGKSSKEKQKREKRVRPVPAELRECKAVRKLLHEKPSKANAIIAVAIDEDVVTVANYFDLPKSTPTVAKKIYAFCCQNKKREHGAEEELPINHHSK